ncbi:MAG: hypothetical protein ABR950_03305 [Candidatus Dormibacteria bacterium]|jgi:hypothetical protein
MDVTRSRRSLALLTTGAAALLAAACGPGAILTAETPDLAVSTALQAVETTPLQASFSGQLTLSTGNLSGLPASIQSALGQIGSGGSATGRLVQESSSRRQLTLSAGGSSLRLVEYDGHAYVSQDGGAYAELSTALPSGAAAASTDLSTAVADLSFQDQGPATVDGVSTEHYSASITVPSLEKLAQDLGGTGSGSAELGPVLTMLAPYVTGSGSADVWLSTRDGSLVRGELTGSVSVDVGAAASAVAGLLAPTTGTASLPTGTLGASLSLQVDVSDYGGSVSVTKPAATSTLPASGGWSGLLGLPSGAAS